MKCKYFLFTALLICMFGFPLIAAAEEKVPDNLLTQDQVIELLKDTENMDAYVKFDDDAYKVYSVFKNKKSVQKDLLKNLPTNKVLYLVTNNEATFKLVSEVVKDLEKSGRTYDDSRYMGGQDDTFTELEKANPDSFRFWFMKITNNNNYYNNDGVRVGVGIFGGRHRGGGIGVGW